MKRYLSIFSTLLVCGLFIPGCGGGGSGGSASDSPGIKSLIIGTWLSECASENGKSVDHTYTFDASGQGTINVYGYVDPNCRSRVAAYKVIFFNYSIGAELSVTGTVNIAYEMNLTRTSWKVISNGVTVLSGGGSPIEYGIVAVENNILYAGLGVDSASNTDSGNRPTTFSTFYIRQ